MSHVQSRSRLRIRDLGRVVTGKTPSTAKPEYFGDDYPFLTPTDMRGCKWSRVTERGLSIAGAATLRGQIPAGAVAVSCIGWQMGKVILTDRPTYTNQQINSIIPNARAHAEYLYYYFATRRDELLSIGSAGGVRTPIISKSSFEAMEVELPELKVQQEIASILSVYDELIENNTRRIAVLEEMARRIYEEWFVRFRYPGHEGVQMVGSELGPVPAGWEIGALGELVEFRKGKKASVVVASPSAGFVPMLLIDALRGGAPVYAKSEKLVTVSPDDSIMVMDGSGSCEVFIGYQGVIGSTLGRYRCEPGKLAGPHWLYLLFATRRDEIRAKNIGAAIPHANKDYISSMLIPRPPHDIVEAFERVVRPMFALCRKLKGKNTNLRTTRDLLLPKLVSGELDVSDLPLPEAVAA